ncbi:MAG: hypothetical protein ACP5I8_15800, partial [Phycisphaerae bacterium]
IAGYFWLGTWRNGYEVLNPKSDQFYESENDPTLKAADGYISALCPVMVAGGATAAGDSRAVGHAGKVRQIMLIGRYGFGVSTFRTLIRPHHAKYPGILRHQTSSPVIPIGVVYRAALPMSAQSPPVRLIQKKLRTLAHSRRSPQRIIYAGADWGTQGDWLGRYGRQDAILCAAGGLGDDIASWGQSFKVVPLLGPHARKGDGVRRWIQWLKTSDPRSLYDPWTGARIEAEWDDHGETYKSMWSGLGIRIAVKLPPEKAVYRVSIYFFNKDGHRSSNRNRDYLIQAGVFPTGPSPVVRSHPLAVARVVNFWGGVYQRFIVRGPGCYLFYVHRNFILNTCVPGFFIDRLKGKDLGANDQPPPGMGDVGYKSPGAYVPPSANTNLQLAGDLWETARALLFYPRAARVSELIAFRAAALAGASLRLLQRWRWKLDIWTSADRRRFDQATQEGFASYQRRQARSAAAAAAQAAAAKKGLKTYVYRGRWANPVK